MEKFNQKLGEKEKPPIAEGEVFDPEKKVKELGKLPRNEKRAKIAKFREKLAFQKEGIGELQEVLEKAIRQNPDAPLAKLCESVELMAPQWGLTNWQKELAKRALTKYVEKHNVVRLLREKYIDDKELYEAFFGRKPRGKLKVFLGPMNIFFQTKDIRDFAFVVQKIFVDKKKRVSSKDIEESLNYGGCAVNIVSVPGFLKLCDIVVIILNEQKPLENKKNKKEFIVHEEQHALNYLVEDIISGKNKYNLENITPEEEELLKDVDKFFDQKDLFMIGVALTRFFSQIRTELEDQAKNEIIAYLRMGALREDIIDRLIEPFKDGGSYDYYAQAKISAKTKPEMKKFDTKFFIEQFGEKFAPMIKKIAKQVFVEDYHKLLEESVDAMFDLQIEGYSNEKIIGLLSTEPLRKWRKVVDRLLAANIS